MEKDHTGRDKTGVDGNSRPLAVGDRVKLRGVVKSMDENGKVNIAIDSSDGQHFYSCDAHCHCCEKAE